ncbi:hypothetical protein A2U01_0044200, partial [Trifolium medium]|nr:hypothetical protein [Trifolium medium]
VRCATCSHTLSLQGLFLEQGLGTGKTIEVVKEQEGLYYLSDEQIGLKVLSSTLRS